SFSVAPTVPELGFGVVEIAGVALFTRLTSLAALQSLAMLTLFPSPLVYEAVHWYRPVSVGVKFPDETTKLPFTGLPIGIPADVKAGVPVQVSSVGSLPGCGPYALNVIVPVAFPVAPLRVAVSLIVPPIVA